MSTQESPLEVAARADGKLAARNATFSTAAGLEGVGGRVPRTEVSAVAMDAQVNGALWSRAWRSMVLRLGGSMLVLALLFYFLPFEQLRAAVRRVPPGLWLAVLAAYVGAHGVAVVKWRLMVNLAGAQISLRQAARCYCAGLFGTLFLPSIVGGDVVRLGLAMRVARNRAGAALGSLLDRMLDITALAIVAGMGAIRLPRSLDGPGRRIFGILVACGALAGVAVLAITLLVPARRWSFRMRRRFARLRQAARSIWRQPQYVGLALGVGVAVQTSFALLTSVIGDACGLHQPPRVWLFAWPLAKLSALLPLTQGGIGVREVALAGLLKPLGTPPVLTIAVGLVWEAVIYSGGLIAGLAALLLGRSTATVPTAAPARTRLRSMRVSSAPAED